MNAELRVKLVAHTPNPEKLVAAAAKLCYSDLPGDALFNDLSEDKASSFIDMLMSIGHQSPIEHISFSFSVEGVSRTLTHQLVRHRIASYSQRSQRYVTEGQFQYIIPPEIEQVQEARDLFIHAMQQDQKIYDDLSEMLYKKHKDTFIKEGIPEKRAASIATKKAIEDARYVLPNACETKIMLTMNARSLMHFFRLRCCERAQWEIREMAFQVLKEVMEVAPSLFKNAGPGCVVGPCPEGKMTCGNIIQVREKYKFTQN